MQEGEFLSNFFKNNEVFNLFHYDYGCLNVHRDRYLVTVVSVLPPKDNHKRSVLWVRLPNKDWINIDALVQSDELILFVGEELMMLSEELGTPIPAVEHCIRVDPNGERIPYSHHQRDPKTPQKGNRCSIALVLGE